jgi:hypothetical protein
MQFKKRPLNLSFRIIFYYFIFLIFSILFSIFIIETIFYFTKKTNINDYKRYFITSGTNGVFDKYNIPFLYKKNSQITHQIWFDTNNSFEREYKYSFTTNNLGLVQKEDVFPHKKSILFLGDSFTEGTGTEPWFNILNKTWPKDRPQLINGAFMGNGFLHWEAIEEYLRGSGHELSNVIVIFISDDLYRKKWLIPNQIINCIDDYLQCEGYEQFLGSPPLDEEINFLSKIKKINENPPIIHTNFKESLKAGLPAMTELYRYFVREKSKIESMAVIKKFIKRYDRRILFVHIPSKEEIEQNIDMVKTYSEPIESIGGRVVSGSKRCKLTINDYYKYDGHPNPTGYLKISECISEILREEWLLHESENK